MNAAETKTVYFVGNCQANALADVYSRFIAPSDNCTVTCSFGAESRHDERLATADVIVYQELEDPKLTLKGAFARIVRFPEIQARFLWPHGQTPHPSSKWYPFLVQGPYAAEFGDRFLNNSIKRLQGSEDAVRQYMQFDFQNGKQLDRFFELSMERLQKRDSVCGSRISEYITNYFQSQMLFLSPGHLSLPLFHRLADHVYTQLGASLEQISEAISKLPWAPFERRRLPVHPYIVEHFKLNPDLYVHYEVLYDGPATFETWALRYMQADWSPALMEGLWRAARRDDTNIIMSLLEQGLKERPLSSHGWRRLAETLARDGKHDDANSAISRASELAPNDPEVLESLARMRLQQQDFAGAELAAQDALSHFEFLSDAQWLLVDALIRQGRLSEAAEAAKCGAGKFPRNPHWWSKAGYVMGLQGNFKASEEAFRRAVAIDPSPGFRANLADAIESQGRRAEAITIVRELVNEGCNDPHIHARLELYLRREGNLAGSERVRSS